MNNDNNDLNQQPIQPMRVDDQAQNNNDSPMRNIIMPEQSMYEYQQQNNVVYPEQQYPNNVVYPEQTYPVNNVNKTNGYAIAGLIVSLFVSVIIGLILSCIGLAKAKEYNNGKGLAIAGIIISIVKMIIVSVLCILIFTFVGPIAKEDMILNTACSLTIDGKYSEESIENEYTVECENYVCTYKKGDYTNTKNCLESYDDNY